VKLNKESSLVDNKLTTTDLDLIFTKSKGAGLKRLDYNTFTVALRHIADKKGLAYEDVVAQIVGAGGPSTGNASCSRIPQFIAHEQCMMLIANEFSALALLFKAAGVN
jgi:hypothetical protein